MTSRLLVAGVVLLALAGCTPSAPTPTPTPTPSLDQSYGECVEGVQMDPDDVQSYIDEVQARCGDPD